MGHNRAAGFEDIMLIFISIISNSMNFLMNKKGYYSSFEQSSTVLLFFFTLLNLVLGLMTEFTRTRMVKIKILTYLWVLLSFGVGVLIEWYPYTSKKFHSVSFSAQPHYNFNIKAILKEGIVVAFRNIIKLSLLGFFTIFTFNNILNSIDLHRAKSLIEHFDTEFLHDSWGSLLWADDAHTYKLYLRCYGDVFANKKNIDTKLMPIILYGHGGTDTGYSSAVWLQEMYNLNLIDRYCTYDRPGYGLSDSAPAPLSISTVADGLKHALLKEANITGPFITVGYDMGGLVNQVFAAKNNNLVKGIMLIDSWHPDVLMNKYLKKSLPGDYYNHNSNFKIPPELHKPHSFSIFFKGILSTLGLNLQTSMVFAHHGSRERVLGSDMIYQGKYLRSKFLESITNSILSYNDVVDSLDRLTDIPISVVSSKNMIKKNKIWGRWQRELTLISSRTFKWKIAEGDHELYKSELGKEALREELLKLGESH